MSEKHSVWMVPYPLSMSVEFQSSCIMFDLPVDEAQMKYAVETDSIPFKILFETIDLNPEEETSLLQAVRGTFSQ